MTASERRGDGPGVWWMIGLGAFLCGLTAFAVEGVFTRAPLSEPAYIAVSGLVLFGLGWVAWRRGTSARRLEAQPPPPAQHG